MKNKYLPLSARTFPAVRLSRLRAHKWLRDLVQENHLTTDDLIWSIIVRDPSLPDCVPTMPGVTRYTVTDLPQAIIEARELGIKAIALFTAVPNDQKCNQAKMILDESSLLYQAIRAIKKTCPEMGVFSDVALDPFTAHGQDCLVINNKIQNDATLTLLSQAAVLQARAGADVIAPSDMMDGRVQAIRQALDDNDLGHIPIASYGAKYASNFYGPYRDVINTSQCLGAADKKTYQMNYGNAREAYQEVALDINEGADMIIIKPGISYLDIVAKMRDAFEMPIISFQVSGEYSMLKFASLNGALDYKQALMEQLISFKRAGADAIITYAACDAAKIITAKNGK